MPDVEQNIPLTNEEKTQNPIEQFVSYAAGSNAGEANYHELKSRHNDQVSHIINGTIKNSWIKTRPKFILAKTDFATEELSNLFARDKLQDYGFYGHPFGGRFIFVIGGNIISYDPISDNIKDLNPNGKRPFSRFVHFIYHEHHTKYYILRDGINPPVIIEGDSSRLASREDREIWGGTMMLSTENYLAAVDQDRQKIYYSDHRLDENSHPLKYTWLFDEVDAIRYFEPSRKGGRIVGAETFTVTDQNKVTELDVFFQEYSTVTYNTGIYRKLWGQSEIRNRILPSVGACAHNAIIPVDNDIIFSDQNGRIRSLRHAIYDEIHRLERQFDRAVYPYYENENKYLRRWRSSIELGGRVLTTVQPEFVKLESNDSYRFNVRHRGIVVLQNDVTARYKNFDERIWDGLWTGIKPEALVKGYFSIANGFSSKEIGIALAIDDDGNRRIYKIKDGEIYDKVVNDKSITINRAVKTTVVPPWLDFQSYAQPKKLESAFLRLGAYQGRLDIIGRWLSDGYDVPINWFSHKDFADNCLLIENEKNNKCKDTQSKKKCILKDANAGVEPRLNLPTLADKTTALCKEVRTFYKGRPILDFIGNVELNEMYFEASPQTKGKNRSTNCNEPTEKKQFRGCKWNPYEFVFEEKEEVKELENKKELCLK